MLIHTRMPRRRNRRRRRPRRRRRQIVPRNKISRNPVVSLKFRLADYLYTGPTGVVQGLFNVNSLTAAYIPGNTGATPIPLVDVTNAKNLFDMYRVRAVKIELTPRYDQAQYLSVTDATPATASTTWEAVSFLPNCCITYDVDNQGQLANYSEMITRERKHMFSIFKKTKHYQPIVKAKQATSSQALFGMRGGWNNLQNELGNVQGVIDIKSDVALTTNGGADTVDDERMMNLIATYYVQFRFRQ